MAFRRYGDPRLLITLWAASNSPDCVTLASSPAKATSFLGLSNLEMSPISLIMAAPVTLPIPVMVVMRDSSFPIMPAIYSAPAPAIGLNGIDDMKKELSNLLLRSH